MEYHRYVNGEKILEVADVKSIEVVNVTGPYMINDVVKNVLSTVNQFVRFNENFQLTQRPFLVRSGQEQMIAYARNKSNVQFFVHGYKIAILAIETSLRRHESGPIVALRHVGQNVDRDANIFFGRVCQISPVKSKRLGIVVSKSDIVWHLTNFCRHFGVPVLVYKDSTFNVTSSRDPESPEWHQNIEGMRIVDETDGGTLFIWKDPAIHARSMRGLGMKRIRLDIDDDCRDNYQEFEHAYLESD